MTALSKVDSGHLIALKREEGKNIAIYGSVSVVRELSKLGLVDEYDLLVHPIFLGKGTPIFH